MGASTSKAEPYHANPIPSPDGAYEAPNRKSRDVCYQARDAFFACLDRHGIIDSVREGWKAEKECGAELRGLERECAASWVTYFKERRVMEAKKARTLEQLKKENAERIPGTLGGLDPNVR
ncbi:hypothetical protein MMC21_001777 [Puttea exsequens]|nr:hypothetical protein [Puttea exsequens]